MAEEGDDEHHEDDFAQGRLEVVDAGDLQPGGSRVGLAFHGVYLVDKQFVDTHAEDDEHHSEEVEVNRFDEFGEQFVNQVFVLKILIISLLLLQ